MKCLSIILFSMICFNGAFANVQDKVESKDLSTSLQPWQIIPPTPDLPKPEHSGYLPINGIKI